MSTPPLPPMPDFNRMASGFDRYLPQIQPVALALLDRLPPLAPGAAVLDVACGTGEPGLSLARRSPGVSVLGVDCAPAMIEVARAKATKESLGNARFDVMSSDSLGVPDASVDAVISRFGLLMVGDVPASAREIARVLREGGSFSLAVWDDMALNTLVNTMVQVLLRHLPAGYQSPLARMGEWAGAGLRARLLEEAGITAIGSEMFHWTYEFASFEEPWELLGLMGGVTGQSKLSAEAQTAVKSELMEALEPHRLPAGGYRIPHACRLFWGRRG